MAYLNRVTLIGNLGQDPEIKTTQSGNKFANMSIATTEKWKDKTTGEKKERTQWHRIVVWNDFCVGIAEKLKKGNQVFVDAQLETRKWEDKDGKTNYVTEVVVRPFSGNLLKIEFVGGGNRQSVPDADDSSGAGTASAGGSTTRKPPADDDDEIPF